MAGHNKWSKVKRLKGALDVKRGKLFSRFSKEITVAARIRRRQPIHESQAARRHPVGPHAKHAQ